MGYESRLYVVKKGAAGFWREVRGKKLRYGEVVAMFDLCTCYPVSDKMRRYPETDCYIFFAGVEDEIVEGCYGEALREIPLPDALKIIEQAMQVDEHYRRYAPCLALLKSFEPKKWGDLVVLHYGH